VSEFRDVIKAIVTDREVGTVERCVNLVTGAVFYAEYEEITPLDLLTELGNDPREAAKLHVSDRAAAAALRSNQSIAIDLYGVACVFTVVQRENNPGSSQATFTLKYQVPGKDS